MAILYSNLAQHTLSQSSNIQYLIRNATRMNTVPDDRKIDYSFRDLFLTLLTTFINIWAMRLGEALYMAPNYVKLLGFHNFANEYSGIAGAKNYKLLPRPLESRLMGDLASEKSFYQVGNLLAKYDTLKLKKGSDAYNERKLLGEHFERRFDPQNYWRAYYQLDATSDIASKKAQTLYDVVNDVKGGKIPNFAVDELGRTPEKLSAEAESIFHNLLTKHEPKLKEIFGSDWKTKIIPHVKHGQAWDRTIPALIRDGLSSRFVQHQVSRARQGGSWFKLALGFAANTIVYAGIANWIDFNVVQPWQKKLVERRGTTSEFIAPQLWSLIPMAGVFTLMHFLTKKVPGYAMRFGLNAGVALFAYCAIAGTWIKSRLSKPPTGKYAKLAEHGLHEHEEKQKNLALSVNPPTQRHSPFDVLKVKQIPTQSHSTQLGNNPFYSPH